MLSFYNVHLKIASFVDGHPAVIYLSCPPSRDSIPLLTFSRGEATPLKMKSRYKLPVEIAWLKP